MCLNWKIYFAFLSFFILVGSIVALFYIHSFLILGFLICWLILSVIIAGREIQLFDEFLHFILFPFTFFIFLYWKRKCKKLLSGYSLNIHRSAVAILAYYDPYKLKYWLKSNYEYADLYCISEYLKAKRGDDFSFFVRPTEDDIKSVMTDQSVREVLFVGHGDSHTFVLNDDEDIFYCEFNRPECSKDFIHQVHCGTKNGKSLIDYVVPGSNKDKCFFFPRAVNSIKICKWFKAQTKKIKLQH